MCLPQPTFAFRRDSWRHDPNHAYSNTRRQPNFLATTSLDAWPLVLPHLPLWYLLLPSNTRNGHAHFSWSHLLGILHRQSFRRDYPHPRVSTLAVPSNHQTPAVSNRTPPTHSSRPFYPSRSGHNHPFIHLFHNKPTVNPYHLAWSSFVKSQLHACNGTKQQV